MKVRRLSSIAKWINENMKALGYEAKIVEGFCNTDTKISGTRLRRAGKGRYGNMLIVSKNGVKIKEHNSAETYRSNDEVESWLKRELENNKKETCEQI